MPLTEVVSLTEKQGFSVIQRIDGKITTSVTADVDFNVTTNQDLVADLGSGPLPKIARKHGIAFAFSGREEERAKSFADLQMGAVIAIGVIFLILAWVFASYTRPLAVMLIIPFGLVAPSSATI